MGLGGISIWQLLIILVIVFAIFGTKRLRNIGGDLGSAIRGFKEGLNEQKTHEEESSSQQLKDQQTKSEFKRSVNSEETHKEP